MVEHLKAMGFQQSVVDPCLYKIETDDGTMFMCVYVDDLCMASSNKTIHRKIMDELHKTFELKDTGDLTWIFGTAIHQDLERGYVTVSQKLYAEDTVMQLKSMIEKLSTTRSRSVPCSDEIISLEVLQEGELIDPEYTGLS